MLNEIEEKDSFHSSKLDSASGTNQESEDSDDENNHRSGLTQG